MNKKEIVKARYTEREYNPSREERIKALFNGQLIQIKEGGTVTYYKLDKYKRLCFSSTGHESSFHPYYKGFDYAHVLDDYNEVSNVEKRIVILA